MNNLRIIVSVLCVFITGSTSTAVAESVVVEKAVGPRVLGYEIAGREGNTFSPGAGPVAHLGTKLLPGEVGSPPVSQQFTIRNTGNETLTFNTPAVKVAGSPAFSVSQPAASGLLPGGTTTFEVTFTRNTFGVHVGAVFIDSNYVPLAPYAFAIEGRTFHASEPEEYNVVGSLPIPDANPVGVDVPFLVEGLQGRLCTVVFKVNGTCPGSPGISHTWMEDLDLSLVSPAGTTVTLIADRGGSGDNLCNTIFDDTADVRIATGSAPFTGTFRPESPLYELTGQAPNGLWKLHAVDDEAVLTGAIHDVTLVLTTEASDTAATHWELFE